MLAAKGVDLKQEERLNDIWEMPIATLLEKHYTGDFASVMGSIPNGMFADIERRWSEKHRYYHTDQHLRDIITELENGPYRRCPVGLSFSENLVVGAFHDIIYDPTRSDNEEQSAEYWLKCSPDATDEVRQKIYDAIVNTKKLFDVSNEFQYIDMAAILLHRDHAKALKNLKWEQAIYKEYQFVDIDTYRAKRLEFLENSGGLGSDVLYEHVETFVPRVGLYAGSFNPFTYGHLDILRQAEGVFDKVILAVGINPNKTTDNMAAYERLKETLKFHEVVYYHGALADELQRQEDLGQDVTLVRGIRNGYDLEHERQLLYPSQRIKPDLKSVMILCHHEYEMVSSTVAREMARLDRDALSIVPTTKEIYDLVD